jgi:hypothetical protein
MNSKAHLSPLVKTIVSSAIRNIKQRENTLPTYKLNADLVPRISERILIKNKMQESVMQVQSTQPTSYQTQQPSQVQTPQVQSPAQPSRMLPLRVVTQPTFLPVEEDLAPKQEEIQPTPSTQNLSLRTIYNGKIAGLINDPSVLSVECLGPNVPVTVFRLGQKQKTKVVLSKVDIDNMLSEISSQTKIPLSEGVFKVVVNNLMLNAIISDLIGTRFVIKKMFQTSQR